MKKMDYILELSHVEFPAWLLDQVFSEENKAYIETPEINAWALAHLLPRVQNALGLDRLTICANHVHVGDAGLDPHDHLPHAFTSVLYLTAARGELVIERPRQKALTYRPEEGLFLFFPAKYNHWVRPSPQPELRVALVSNYELLPAV